MAPCGNTEMTANILRTSVTSVCKKINLSWLTMKMEEWGCSQML